MQKIQCLTGERKIAKGNLTQKKKKGLVYDIYNIEMRSQVTLFCDLIFLLIFFIIFKYFPLDNTNKCSYNKIHKTNKCL